MKTILIFLLSTTILLATPDIEEIIENPIEFANYGCCFMVKGKKQSKPFIYQFDSFAGVMYFMSEFGIKKVYVRDCDNQSKWRKLTRIERGD